VAARSLAECLRLQIERLPADACEDEPLRALALRVVDEHLDLLALHDAPLLARKLQCDEESIRRANRLIRRLDPRPGIGFGGDPAGYVVADVIVKRVGGRWVATINPQAVPELRVNRALADLVRQGGTAPESFARYLQEARWMVRNVQQRFETIRRVAQAIVDRQKLYFDLGELALRPLVLRDVARELGLHPSTVSRVACNKYAQTPAGLVELRRFFANRASHRQGAANVSSTAIRALIRKLVAAEAPQAPLSDVQITHLLASRGIKVARRTVAKYRDAIGVPPLESRRMTATAADARAASVRPIAALASERRARRRAQPGASDSPSLPYSFRRL
jgi:RNA polymerase sigma-54 factor